MAVSQHDPHDSSNANGRLVAAVMAKDSHMVRECLQDGADPNTSGPDGLPLLCTAVDGFDHKSVDALVDYGADPDAVLPDGTTPLWRAVDLGSPAMVGITLGKDPRLRIPEVGRKRLLGLARDWYETGQEEELRRRTGASGPATRRLVKDNEFTDIEEVSLGGLTVRAGHSGVLTELERAFGILPPVAELVARAVPYPDRLHANWCAVSYALAHHKSPQAWSDLTALRHHPDPVHRRLLADVLWSRASWRTSTTARTLRRTPSSWRGGHSTSRTARCSPMSWTPTRTTTTPTRRPSASATPTTRTRACAARCRTA